MFSKPMFNESPLIIYLLLLSVVIAIYLFRRQRASQKASAIYAAAAEAGLIEPPSLHPLIDPVECLGCGICSIVCPEGNVISIIRNKAVLIEPTHCIGHGACAQACPTNAISLVFGTEKRGVDIPFVGEDFQTNVPGLYIAGELGGMGLIRNAIEQGRQAMEAIRASLANKQSNHLDTFIIGAGPAGFSATLAAKKFGLDSVTVEQEALGGTVAHYPRGKLVMTTPVDLPIIGKVKLKDPSKEHLLEFWKTVEKKSGISIRYDERVTDIKSIQDGFEVHTTKSTYATKTVLLAIGRRGTPRKLDVPGEDLGKVVYRMIDPEQYAGRNVLIVGGGDSALEAAADIGEQPGSKVILSYRNAAFSRARQRNRERIEKLCADGSIEVMMQSSVRKIAPDHIVIEQKGEHHKAANDDVIICAGGILPTMFLKSIGIEVDTKFGTV